MMRFSPDFALGVGAILKAQATIARLLSVSLLMSHSVLADGVSDRRSNPNFEGTRQAVRESIMGITGRAPYASNDRVEGLVELPASQIIRNVYTMEQMGLNSAQLPIYPWSDDYWAIYKGVLGARYADPSFPGSADWSANAGYVKAKDNDVASIVKSGNTRDINLLSPSEKYDLLVGDSEGTLTRTMWSEGQGYFQASGKVETWMGICHGWAVASYMLPRPQRSIVMTAADGKTQITFYPSDIKALASLLWAKAPHNTRFVSGRCNTKDPSRTAVSGNALGRTDDQVCFDTNPGTWHMTAVNRIGVEKRSFVMDVTYDYEVWNQPVYSYSVKYFNPETGTVKANAREATIAYSAYKSDPYKAFRKNSAMTKIVGVEMDVTYVVETQPRHQSLDSPAYDQHRSVKYRYDLELDDSGQILGGEWYTSLHPDFLWTAASNVKIQSVGDYSLANAPWDPRKPVPAIYKIAAKRASALGQPLSTVLDGLIQLSK